MSLKFMETFKLNPVLYVPLKHFLCSSEPTPILYIIVSFSFGDHQKVLIKLLYRHP